VTNWGPTADRQLINYEEVVVAGRQGTDGSISPLITVEQNGKSTFQVTEVQTTQQNAAMVEETTAASATLATKVASLMRLFVPFHLVGMPEPPSIGLHLLPTMPRPADR
jgi:hypothetical protein